MLANRMLSVSLTASAHQRINATPPSWQQESCESAHVANKPSGMQQHEGARQQDFSERQDNGHGQHKE